MSRLAEAVQNITVAFRLAIFDGAAAAQAPNDGPAAWRSFAALPIAMVLQMIAASMTMQLLPGAQAAADEAGGSGFAGLLWFATSWLLAITIATEAARHLGRLDVIARYVILFNWAAALQGAVLAFALTAFASASQVSLILVALIGFWSLLYDWYVAKTILNIPGGAAALIVGMQKGAAWFLLKLFAG